MSPGDIVALVIVLFFVIGIIVGFIAVIALSAIRRDRVLTRRRLDPSILDEADEADETDDETDDYRTGASGVAGHWDGIKPSNDRPHWPGDTEGGFPGGTS